ncbi:MAG: hypothetical protein KKA67_03735, partial [Spirochaetes bacterium]|nr:hypothetical protein [Spirochaetota bacterium]
MPAGRRAGHRRVRLDQRALRAFLTAASLESASRGVILSVSKLRSSSNTSSSTENKPPGSGERTPTTRASFAPFEGIADTP